MIEKLKFKNELVEQLFSEAIEEALAELKEE